MSNTFFATHPRKLERDRIVARELQRRAYATYHRNIEVARLGRRYRHVDTLDSMIQLLDQH